MIKLKYFWVVLGMVASLACTAADSQLTSVTTILGKVRVGIVEHSVPFSYTTTDSDGPIGHQVDLAHQLARDMGVEISFRSAGLDALILELNKGNIDIIMAGTPMNAATAKRAAFTRPWGRTGITPVALKSAAGRLSDWNALQPQGIRLGAANDPAVTSFIENLFSGKTFDLVDSSPDAVNSLVDGKLDVYVTNTIEASVLSRIDNRLGPLFPARSGNRRPLACLVKLDDPIWLHYVNTWLTIKQESGYLAALAGKWGLVGQQ